MLRQLAQYHAKDPNNLFMVRLAQVGGKQKEPCTRHKLTFGKVCESVCVFVCTRTSCMCVCVLE